MPTYSYACKECGNAFDVHQSFDEDALTECPRCGGPLRKLFGKVGVVFKGSGFYRTDSRGGTSSVPARSGGEAKPGDAKAGAGDPGTGTAGGKDTGSTTSSGEGSGSAAPAPAAGVAKPSASSAV